MTFKVRVTGTKELKKLLKQLGKPFMNEVGKRTVKTAEKHLKRTYARKVDTGTLKRSIRSRWFPNTTRGFVTLGGETTTRGASRNSKAADYAKFIEFGFRSHFFPMSTTRPDSKFYSTDIPYGHVSGYGGLHGLSKSEEKTRKELGSIAKKAFDVVVTRR